MMEEIHIFSEEIEDESQFEEFLKKNEKKIERIFNAMKKLKIKAIILGELNEKDDSIAYQ